MSDGDGTQGPATNLLRSLVQLGGTLLGVAHTRVELLTTELGEDLARGLEVLLWLAVALLAGVLGALLAGIAIIVYFWDTYRMGAVVGVTALYLLLAAYAGISARRRLAEMPRLLDATRTELQHDVTTLRSDQ